MTPPTVAGFFAGIGGMELGFQRAGLRTTLLCEIDPVARSVLSKQFGVSEDDMPTDIRQVARLPDETDVVCGGFPCQDLSSSGQKKGITGTQSSLVDALLDLIEDAHARGRGPSWVVLENVAFMLKLQKGYAIRHVTGRLAKIGYRWAYRVIDSNALGLPQRRRRVFIVASAVHDPRRALFATDVGRPKRVKAHLDRPLGFYWTEGTHAHGMINDGIPPLKGGSTIGIPSPPAVFFPKSGYVGTPNIVDAERMQGFDRDWTLPATAAGHRASLRWRLVGNAVSVPVAEWIAQGLLKPGEYDGADDPIWSGPRGWPDAAWWDTEAQVIRVASLSDWPVHVSPVPLDEFLDLKGMKPLSRRATMGFVKRARKGTLRYPEGFLDQLEAHALTKSPPAPSAQ